MVSMDPGDVVRNVVHRSDSAKRVALVIGLEHEAEGHIIAKAVPALRKGLTGQAVAKVIDPVLSNGPSVPNRYAPGMAPGLWGNRVGEVVFQALFILLYNQPRRNSLVLGKIHVKLGNVLV